MLCLFWERRSYLSTCQVLCTVYRGIAGRVLPPVFRTPGHDGSRGGCELGFMSCTTSRAVALSYAGQAQPPGELTPDGEPFLGGTLLEARMSMFHRGAQVPPVHVFVQSLFLATADHCTCRWGGCRSILWRMR